MATFVPGPGSRYRGLCSVVVALLLEFPLAVALSPMPSTQESAVRTPVSDTSNDLSAQAVAPPGYANGNLAYQEGLGALANPSPQLPASCLIRLMTLQSFTPSTNFGNPKLLVTLNATALCGLAPFSVTWVFGDGNRTSQSQANASWSGPSGSWYESFIYSHTYGYVGSFIAKCWITDSAGTNVSGSASVFVSFSPSLFYSFYNESGLLQKGDNGSGHTIGLVEECNSAIPNENAVYQSDLNTFDSEFSIPATTLSFFISGGTTCTSPGIGWSTQETSLDIEWAHVAAPGAKIQVCLDTLGDVAGWEGCDSYFEANGVSIVSNSWGFCGASDPQYLVRPTCTNATDPYGKTWQQAEQGGSNFFASSGDHVQSICDTANYPASNPYAVAVGATTIESVGRTGGYGSERIWSSSTSTEQCSYKRGNNWIGVSSDLGETFGTNPYYSAPSWQSAVLENTYRYFPDVSMVGDPATGVPIVSQGVWYIVGGTSVGSPIWSGILAVLLQSHAPGLSGFSAPFLYSNPGCFHMITNSAGGQDGMGTPNIGCLAAA
jgi:subtilase family serine protease